MHALTLTFKALFNRGCVECVNFPCENDVVSDEEVAKSFFSNMLTHFTY